MTLMVQTCPSETFALDFQMVWPFCLRSEALSLVTTVAFGPDARTARLTLRRGLIAER